MISNLVQRSRNFATAWSFGFFMVGFALLIGWSTFFPHNAKRKVVTPNLSTLAFRVAPPPPVPAPPAPVPAAQPVPPPPVEKKPVPKKPVKKVQKKKPVKKKKAVSKKPVKKAVPKKKVETPPQVEEVAQPPSQQPVAEAKAPDKPASPPPAPPAAPQEVSREQISLAVGDIALAIDRHKKYPKAARRAGYGGVVKLKVELTASGVVTSCILLESSGRRKLDDAALKAAQKIVGKKVTSAMLRDGLVVTVPVRFFLK